ncbi:MAG: hydroxysqualene dehydroxylase HpnE [Chlorobi bacterium]|nr:hydroxysqualene dehydroxylase HpnE [Chlorobiota bacterium]MCI0716783.1 hydroxysqualene dehydroxylase HpnE [Chlorobiota bacterium]
MTRANHEKSVTVIGGGVSGLSAAVFFAKENFKVTLVEASPKLGGRTYSFFDNIIGAEIDNGQHILASWYHNTFEFLKIIGSYDKLTFQKQLEVKFIDDSAKEYLFKCPKLPPPFHLLSGIMRYKALRFKDKKALVKLINTINRGRISEDKLRAINTNELFKITGQSERLSNYFWKPFIIAVFNAKPENTSAYLFSQIIKAGFLEKNGSKLVLPNEFLSKLFVDPAFVYLKNKNSNVITNNRVAKINFEDRIVNSLIIEDNTKIRSDFYISAVPFFELKNLFEKDAYDSNFKQVEGLKSSPIVNIHLKFDKSIDNIFNKRFAGLLNTQVQWIFKVKSDQMCLVISAAKEVSELDKNEIVKFAQNELEMCIPEFKNFKIIASRVIKEMRATFVPDKNSLSCRPKNATKFKNFFIAGDWTNTGLPATIEGAVKSSKQCVNYILSAAKNLTE